MELNAYMEQGIESIASALSQFYLSDNKGKEFLRSFASALEISLNIRNSQEAAGRHIPPFLIASIASSCNLRCAGCFARADGMCSEAHSETELGADEWKRIFSEASALGISFILLSGGEPLLRREIIELAAGFPNIIFPIFTNGTLMNEKYLGLFDEHRNLVPVFSLEGAPEQTDIRRGQGVSKNIETLMIRLRELGILFAVSITVTNQNLHMVATESFLSDLRRQGCGFVFFVEYVPAEAGTERLVLSDGETDWLSEQILRLKSEFSDMGVLDFPGDEKYMGGCLAAGRGFFHINPFGAAEACPFSPFSQMNLKDHSISQILDSEFFRQVREIGTDAAQHPFGGCALFSRENEVRSLL